MVLIYSLSLWKFRCDLLYGRTKDEAAQKIMTDLRNRVIQAYREYEQDPFMVRNDYRHSFAIALDRWLLQDRDCLQCFLAPLDLAKEERVLYMNRQSERAQKFFFPRSLPNLVHLGHTSDSSILSELTGFTDLHTHSIEMDSIARLDVHNADNVSLLDSDSQSTVSHSSTSGKTYVSSL